MNVSMPSGTSALYCYLANIRRLKSLISQVDIVQHSKLLDAFKRNTVCFSNGGDDRYCKPTILLAILHTADIRLM